jgi:hypothetical protein
MRAGGLDEGSSRQYRHSYTPTRSTETRRWRVRKALLLRMRRVLCTSARQIVSSLNLSCQSSLYSPVATMSHTLLRSSHSLVKPHAQCPKPQHKLLNNARRSQHSYCSAQAASSDSLSTSSSTITLPEPSLPLEEPPARFQRLKSNFCRCVRASLALGIAI